MCYQKFHQCKYCKTDYECRVDNYTCPTLNHDADMNMCPLCKIKLETLISSLTTEELDAIDPMDIDNLMRRKL